MFYDFIRRSARFIQAIRKPEIQNLFEEFLRQQVYTLEENTSSKNSMKSGEYWIQFKT